MLTVLTVPAFAGIEAGAREYEQRCADYYAQQYGVEPAFVRAVIEVESAWDPSAVSGIRGHRSRICLTPFQSNCKSGPNPTFLLVFTCMPLKCLQ
jgi:hypothetical protein